MGLCFDGFTLRFLLEGAARVGGGVPILSRAAAFTAADALNGLGLRGFDGIVPSSLLQPGSCNSNATSTLSWEDCRHLAKATRLCHDLRTPRLRGGLCRSNRKNSFVNCAQPG